MKYYLDSEFIESFHKPLFGKRRHFIDLISIGIVAEDGRTYYAISNEFDSRDASDWVYDNVIMNIMVDWAKSFSGDMRNDHLRSIEGKGKHGSVKMMQKAIGKSNKKIAKEIIEFVFHDVFINFKGAEQEFHSRTKKYGWETEPPEFYAYYADYDWVLFCSLFGTMMDLPKGFPQYCRDLKQMLDEKERLLCDLNPNGECLNKEGASGVFSEKFFKKLTNHPLYPAQKNEHNALADAKWNKELHEFLKNLK